jgi:iron complex transport system substrate-binding protein
MLKTALILLAPALLAAAEPRRIISTAPSITEMLFALGLGDRVVGVTTYCHYPEAAKAKPRIGSYLEMNYEAVLAAKPDLVILMKSPLPHAGKLGSLRIPLLEIENEPSLASIRGSIRSIAQAAGVSGKGESLIQSIDTRLKAVEQRAAKLPRRSLTFIVGRDPGQLTGLVAVGGSNFLNELMRIAGGANTFADAGSSYPKIAVELLLSRNPDVILDMGEMADTTGVTEQQKQRVVALYTKYPALRAFQRKAIHAIASDIYVVPGPRVADAAEAFFRFLHPEEATR